jgi:hypothetical protein
MSRQTTDLRHLNWSTNPKGTKGTAGTFLKSEPEIDGIKSYYKLSQYNKVSKVYGHESVLEVIAYKFIDALGLDCVKYDLIHGIVKVDDEEFETYACASEEFKKAGETKIDLDIYYEEKKINGETTIEFCHRLGFENEINALLLVDYIIASRDRHGANIELLKDLHGNLRVAPIFDNGVSLTQPYYTEADLERFDWKADITANNFLGTQNLRENLKYITNPVVVNAVDDNRITDILKDFKNILSEKHIETIKEMLLWRYDYAKQQGILVER